MINAYNLQQHKLTVISSAYNIFTIGILINYVINISQ